MVEENFDFSGNIGSFFFESRDRTKRSDMSSDSASNIRFSGYTLVGGSMKNPSFEKKLSQQSTDAKSNGFAICIKIFEISFEKSSQKRET